MRIPGFTAEMALSGGGTYSETAPMYEASSAGAAVNPQACVNIGPCRVCVTVRVFPPRACLQFSCLGFNRSFCVP